MTQELNDNHVHCKRLLELIDVPAEAPSIEALNRLVPAFLRRVPFENVSKISYYHRTGKKMIPNFATYVDGIEKFNFGGTCYSNNGYLNQLLRYLGYDARLCGADMSNPDVHVVNMVTVEGREFLVDTGYAAPFFAPLPRDLDEPYDVSMGRDRYVINPQDGDGKTRVDLYRDGELAHGYTAKPTDRPIEFFADAIADSYREDGSFLTSLLLVRYLDDRRIVSLRGYSVIEADRSSYKIKKLTSKSELPGVVNDRFGIPEKVVQEVLGYLKEPEGD